MLFLGKHWSFVMLQYNPTNSFLSKINWRKQSCRCGRHVLLFDKINWAYFFGVQFFWSIAKNTIVKGVYKPAAPLCVTLTEIDGVPSAKKLIWAKHLVGETCSWFTNRICHDKNAPSKFIAKGVIASLLSLEIRTSLVNSSSFFLVVWFSVQSCH